MPLPNREKHKGGNFIDFIGPYQYRMNRYRVELHFLLESIIYWWWKNSPIVRPEAVTLCMLPIFERYHDRPDFFFCDPAILESICYRQIANRLINDNNTTGGLKKFGQLITYYFIGLRCISCVISPLFVPCTSTLKTERNCFKKG